MRLLMLTPQLPYPPRQGTTMRNYHLIAHLARRHEVHLLTFVEREGQMDQAGPLNDHCASVRVVIAPRRRLISRLRHLILTPHPDMALRLRSTDFQRALGEMASSHAFDVVQFEGIELAQYLLWLRGQRAPGLPPLPSPLPADNTPLLVFDEHNAEYVLQQRAFETDLRQPGRWIGAAYSFVQWRRLRRYETRACRSADRVVAVSETDRVALRVLSPGLEIAVVPNGVDVAHYVGYRPEPAALPELGQASLVFVGKMDFRPNVDAMLWFADEILPLVRRQVPEARLYVVGMQPHPRVLRLAGRPGVAITGAVADVRAYVSQAAAVVAPLRMGGGTRLKVLEAMALGKAMVCTTVGAEGLGATPGRELLLADSPEAFAVATVELLRGPQRRATLGQAAREFVAARFDWARIVPGMEGVYTDIE
ncbi:MAG: glycosyltransferase family 4 protein [Chloroflexota bacterium]